MTEHEYERRADDAERELADMEERSGKVGEHIDEARKDWEAKVADPAVPGAVGNPERAEEGGRHQETAYPAKGGDGDDDEQPDRDEADEPTDEAAGDDSDEADDAEEDAADDDERASGDTSDEKPADA